MFHKTSFIFLISALIAVNSDLHEFYRWNQISVENKPRAGGTVARDLIYFNYPEKKLLSTITTTTTTTAAPATQDNNVPAIPENIIPMGVNHHNGRVFVTLPRRRVGVPATLTYINLNDKFNLNNPTLIPYPAAENNSLHPTLESDDNRIISVYRTKIDSCKRLWFIDTGLLEYPNNRVQVQRPSIWIMDLETDKLIKRFAIPENIVMNGQTAGLANIEVDISGTDCDQAFAYIPDLLNYRLYVYRFSDDHMWAFRHNYFSFDPQHGDFNISGIEFQWDDGIFSITLGNVNEDGFRTAYFHAMASIYEYTVSTRVLRNETMSTSNHHGNFQCLGPRGANSQTSSHSFDSKTGVIFFAEPGSNSITCWNTAKPYTAEYFGVVAHSDETMIYPSDLNVDNEGTLWVMTNSLPLFIYTSLQPDVVNFRIWKNSVENAIKGTPCAIYVPEIEAEASLDDDRQTLFFQD